jgi:lipoprotein NlpD
MPRPAKVKPKPKPVATVPSAGPLQWRWPTAGRVVERFSAQDRTRNGVKIAGRSGQPILAAEAGRVVYSGSGLIGYGQLIIIKHNKNYLSAYGHNRKILVKEGDQVARGAHIGEMGKPPDDQPLLHFEIRRQGTPVDPLLLLPERD